MATERRTWLFLIGPCTVRELPLSDEGEHCYMATTRDGHAHVDFRLIAWHLPPDRLEELQPIATAMLQDIVSRGVRAGHVR